MCLKHNILIRSRLQENPRGRGDFGFLHQPLPIPVEATEEGYADANVGLCLQVETYSIRFDWGEVGHEQTPPPLRVCVDVLSCLLQV